MKKLHTEDLDSYVAFVDRECNGDLTDPRVLEKYLPISLQHKNKIDETIDPFSLEYFQSQVNLYEEIAGKRLDQWSGELHPVDIASLLNTPNPLGINRVDFIAEHVRALSTMLSLSCLESDATVLDLGAGHGLSSEIYAFCGCRVNAVDIDPALSELATKRAAARSFKIKRSVMNFDSLTSIENDGYMAAFFFQSLHHCLRPWLLIEQIATKLSHDGVIAFCGEPVNDLWWKHWGIRLDQESIYVARKYGWFESGWSRGFITECFRRNGFELVLFDTGLKGGLMGMTSKNSDKLAKIVDGAVALGFTPIFAGDIENSPRNFHTQIGKLTKNALGTIIRANANHNGGYLCYGPYISLPPGRYSVTFILRFTLDESQGNLNPLEVMFDIVGANDMVALHKEAITLTRNDRPRLINVEIELAHHVQRLETRVHLPHGKQVWEMSIPVIERVDPSQINGL